MNHHHGCFLGFTYRRALTVQPGSWSEGRAPRSRAYNTAAHSRERGTHGGGGAHLWGRRAHTWRHTDTRGGAHTQERCAHTWRHTLRRPMAGE